MAGMNGPDRKPWLHGRCESLRVDTNFNAAVINGFDLPGQALIDLTELQDGQDLGFVRIVNDPPGEFHFTSYPLTDAELRDVLNLPVPPVNGVGKREIGRASCRERV